MAIFRCKICGGSLDIDGTQSVVTCKYCDTKQTLPKLNNDNDKRANLYDRANHFRRNNDFDKAMGIYEAILNEDTTDAEAYWSIVLCRWGIEYVEDPMSKKRLPTINRAQFTSIFDDEDYKAAIAHADNEQREIYEAEAYAINEIQKGFLAISQKEKPFDVFICYKETDQSGRRTRDSVLATELYHELCREGFKVFFARITLEDKLGIAYEPYIFAALNSAKVMVALGTRPEHFNAVWVKNEWSRYLALIKNGARKTLIPAYRDMDPYDLPEEFSHLQAQDMSRLGFMQDLTRGIKKILESSAPKAEKETVKETIKETVKETVVSSGAPGIVPLLKRAQMALEDGEFASADGFCEQVLNQDPENAQAYLYKLLADLGVSRIELLSDLDQPFDKNKNYPKLMRFGDEKLKEAVSGYVEKIITRNRNALLESEYVACLRMMESARKEDEFIAVSARLNEISGYKNSAALSHECMAKAEVSRKEELYGKACNVLYGNVYSNGVEIDVPDCQKAIEIFESLNGWRDSKEKIIACKQKIEEIEQRKELEKKLDE